MLFIIRKPIVKRTKTIQIIKERSREGKFIVGQIMVCSTILNPRLVRK